MIQNMIIYLDLTLSTILKRIYSFYPSNWHYFFIIPFRYKLNSKGFALTKPSASKSL